MGRSGFRLDGTWWSGVGLIDVRVFDDGDLLRQSKNEEKKERVLISVLERGEPINSVMKKKMMMDGIMPYSWQHFDLG